MEENVALDSRKQKQFVKSIKGIKKLIKKNDTEVASDKSILRIKEPKIKRKRPERGLVYLSHIPHGFYEHEMTQYFKQFGVVTNSRVIRSKRTGNSKGCAFVEFKEPAVAEIVAETMNNYLMGKRLIKAAYIPPEKQRRHAMRKHWNTQCNPGMESKIKMRKAYNADKNEKEELKRAKKLLSNLAATKRKLKEMGISYDFFTPVDIPEGLDELKEKSQNLQKEKIEQNNKSKKNKTEDKKNEKISANTDNKINKKTERVEKTKNNKKEIVTPVNIDQKQKQKKIKDAGVKPMENFIKIKQESEDSDNSLEFDSDEYTKMMEEDDDVSSNDENDSDIPESEDDQSNDDESEEEPPKKVKINKKQQSVPKILHPQRVALSAGNEKPAVHNKRKAPKREVKDRPKFEKQNDRKPIKQFKKKK